MGAPQVIQIADPSGAESARLDIMAREIADQRTQIHNLEVCLGRMITLLPPRHRTQMARNAGNYGGAMLAVMGFPPFVIGGTLHAYIYSVCHVADVSLARVIDQNRSHPEVRARNAIVYLALDRLTISKAEIGRAIFRDHSSVCTMTDRAIDRLERGETGFADLLERASRMAVKPKVARPDF